MTLREKVLMAIDGKTSIASVANGVGCSQTYVRHIAQSEGVMHLLLGYTPRARSDRFADPVPTKTMVPEPDRPNAVRRLPTGAYCNTDLMRFLDEAQAEHMPVLQMARLLRVPVYAVTFRLTPEGRKIMARGNKVYVQGAA